MTTSFKRAALGGALLTLAACGTNSPNHTDPGAPTANPDSVSLTGAAATTINVLTNDTHSQGGTLSLQSFDATSMQGGTITRDDAGTPSDQSDDQIIYTPPASFTGTDTFDYVVADQNGATSTGTVTVIGATVGVDRYFYEGSLTSTVDGITIDFTVFVPSPTDFKALDSECTTTNADGYGCVPLLIHSHGFGGSKHPDFSQPATFLDAQMAKRMWEAGYFVITYSQRGFAGSGGSIELMSPYKEGEDFRDVLNWAINHIRTDFNFDSNTDEQFDSANPCHTTPTPAASCMATWGDTLLAADNKNRVDPAATNGDEDPSVGTVGYSYGGGFQFNAQRVDNRLDAIMPMGTWHDLRYSLSSNDNPKSAWIELLTSFAISGGSNLPPPFLLDAGTEARVANTKVADNPHNKAKQVSAVNGNILAPNGPVSYCEFGNEGIDREISGNTPVNADLFMIQGYGDTLFNFNEGFENAYCWEKAGKQPYLLLQTSGHPLPLIGPQHYAGSDTGMYLDEVVHCGYDTSVSPPKPFRIQMLETGFAWFEWKLRQPATAETDFVAKWDVNGASGAANHKHVCITQENTDTTDLLQDSHFNGTTSNPTAYRYSKEGLMLDMPSDIVDSSAYTPIDVPAPALPITTGVPNETFVTLHTEVTGTTVLAGIPLVQLGLTKNDVTDQIIFAGIGIRRAGSTTIDLLHFQTASVRPFETATPTLTADWPVDDPRTTAGMHIYPFRLGDHPQDPAWGRLIGVTARLNQGDEVGLVLNGSHGMYTYNFTTGSNVFVSGPGATPFPPNFPDIKVMLPLHDIGITAPCQQNDSTAPNFCP